MKLNIELLKDATSPVPRVHPKSVASTLWQGWQQSCVTHVGSNQRGRSNDLRNMEAENDHVFS